MDIEKGFITKLLETKDMNFVKDQQVKSSFLYGKHKQAYRYIENSFIENGEIPTVRAFRREFPNYELEEYEDNVGTEESLQFWCQELRRKEKQNKLASAIEETVGQLNDFNTEEAYNLVKKTVFDIESNVQKSSSEDLTKNTEDRILAYQERKRNDGMLGIPTGWSKLDFLIKGFQEGQLNTLIAKTSVGKTWVEVLLGCNAMLNNFRVLQISTEMQASVMRDRYEAVLTSRLVGDISYNRFKSGKLTPEEEERYFTFLREKAPKLEPLIIEETTSGISFISAKIDQYKPDLVLIDGVYLLEDEQQAMQDWKKLLNITRGLKKIAVNKKVPVFINTQADQNTSDKHGPQLGNTAYAKGIEQDSDNVFALFRDEQMYEDKEMALKVLKQREGTLGKVFLEWDFNHMHFGEIYATYEQEGETVTANDEELTEKDKEELGVIVTGDDRDKREEKPKKKKKKKKSRRSLKDILPKSQPQPSPALR